MHCPHCAHVFGGLAEAQAHQCGAAPFAVGCPTWEDGQHCYTDVAVVEIITAIDLKGSMSKRCACGSEVKRVPT